MSASASKPKRPNILFIMSDDHASHAIGAYGSRINETPNLDRLADEGMRFDNCFCTNSICAPSRATILTGTYNHINGVKTLGDDLDGRQVTFPKLLQADGYQTAMIGKWHLGHGGHYDPTGFDYWSVLPDQGDYRNPDFFEMGTRKKFEGYVTDIITDKSLDWIDKRDPERPFMLMCHHKAPHRHWEPDDKHMHLYEDIDIPEPVTFNDDYATRSQAAVQAKMRIDDLNDLDTKGPPPEGLTPEEVRKWKYQRYIKDYLRCIASIDDNVGRMLDYLDEKGLAEDTIVIYTSDQGFFLGDHGWFDKRFMYEESLRMPFLIRYPREIEPGSVNETMILNTDFAPTFLEYAGLPIHERMQGFSIRPLMNSVLPEGWRTSMVYRYWMHLDGCHEVYSHYGIRTHRYKLIYYYAQALGTTDSRDENRPPEWECFDLEQDPYELNNVYGNPDYANTIADLTKQLEKLMDEVQDEYIH
ncbi:sulfatase [Paenibacillus sp. LHD-117]|uniref:sulfatase family protein n=1 Tax=Paenibacillus sp. LHD-117 TaxID=3071412 RepID=UPI0027E0BD91|nr:sulfatase [Paenibacillus sp. LHD-117]MDQ6420194.1 sulfatase [Paenibacillus sp. LHD-117]